MFQHQTVTQYQLIRRDVCLLGKDTYSFMAPFLSSKAPAWSSYSITERNKYNPLHKYHVSLKSQTYIVATAFFHPAGKPDHRYTDMRLSNMIVDSFLSAGGQADRLQFLGINCIVNKFALASMAEDFRTATDEQRSAVVIDGKEAQVVTFTPSKMSENPFVRCAGRVAEALSDAAGKMVLVKAVSLVRQGAGDDGATVHHMVCEFGLGEVVADVAQQVPVGKWFSSKKGHDTIKRTLGRLGWIQKVKASARLTMPSDVPFNRLGWESNLGP